MKLYKGTILIFFLFLCIINISACTESENMQFSAGGESVVSQSETEEKWPEETKIEREYGIEDFMKGEELPENIVWLEGEVPFGDISLGLKPVIGDALKKLIESSEEDDYIGVFVYDSSTCGLVPKIRVNIDIFPEEMNSDGKLDCMKVTSAVIYLYQQSSSLLVKQDVVKAILTCSVNFDSPNAYEPDEEEYKKYGAGVLDCVGTCWVNLNNRYIQSSISSNASYNEHVFYVGSSDTRIRVLLAFLASSVPVSSNL